MKELTFENHLHVLRVKRYSVTSNNKSTSAPEINSRTFWNYYDTLPIGFMLLCRETRIAMSDENWILV